MDTYVTIRALAKLEEVSDDCAVWKYKPSALAVMALLTVSISRPLESCIIGVTEYYSQQTRHKDQRKPDLSADRNLELEDNGHRKEEHNHIDGE